MRDLIEHMFLALIAAVLVDRARGHGDSRESRGFPGVRNARPFVRMAFAAGIGLFFMSMMLRQCSTASGSAASEGLFPSQVEVVMIDPLTTE